MAQTINGEQPVCIADEQALVGEGPVWNDVDGCLWWIDIKNPRLFRTDPKTNQTKFWSMPERIGSFAFRGDGTLICAMQNGFAIFDPDKESLDWLDDPEHDKPGNRFNDGKCDPKGRFFAGSMDDEEKVFSGALYRRDVDGSVTTMERGIGISNGLGWSPDGSIMYYTDTFQGCIWAYDYDVETGSMRDKRIFATIPEKDGYPDGLCVDAEGCVWGSHWDGWRITRYLPDGRLDRVIQFPVPKVSSCCFGGAGMTTLFATSARIDIDENGLKEAPLSGGLFALETGIKGQPSVRFAG